MPSPRRSRRGWQSCRAFRRPPGSAPRRAIWRRAATRHPRTPTTDGTPPLLCSGVFFHREHYRQPEHNGCLQCPNRDTRTGRPTRQHQCPRTDEKTQTRDTGHAHTPLRSPKGSSDHYHVVGVTPVSTRGALKRAPRPSGAAGDRSHTPPPPTPSCALSCEMRLKVSGKPWSRTWRSTLTNAACDT